MLPAELRKLAADGQFAQPTAGFCPGYVQANLAAFPKAYADDFTAFCKANPQPCPLLETIGPENSTSMQLAPGADIRKTIPKYRIWRDGMLHEEVESIEKTVTDDMVYFLLGCSFSFEEALVEAGIALRHLQEKKNVAMYRTSIPLSPVGPFTGEMVVSMRPIQKEKVELAKRITSQYPDVHGAPVHVDNPAEIGIGALEKPDYGEFVEIRKNEIPVFWACGVTPQNVILNAKLPLAITHAPGFMFVSDRKNTEYAVTAKEKSNT